jgi:hypothetical protein
MIRVKAFFCADSVSVDSQKQTISAFHIAEGMYSPSYPVVIPKIVAIGIFGRDSTDPSSIDCFLKVQIGADHLAGGPMKLEFQGKSSARSVAEIQTLVVPKPGNLVFSLHIEEEIKATWTVEMSQAPRFFWRIVPLLCRSPLVPDFSQQIVGELVSRPADQRGKFGDAFRVLGGKRDRSGCRGGLHAERHCEPVDFGDKLKCSPLSALVPSERRLKP